METSSVFASTTVNQTAIATLPLNGRDFRDFALLTPRVQDVPGIPSTLRVGRLAEGRWPAWSPDGRQIAFIDRAGTSLHVVEATGGFRRRLAPEPDEVADYHSSWSRDGLGPVAWEHRLHQPGREERSHPRALGSRHQGDTGAGLPSESNELWWHECGLTVSPDGQWVVYTNADEISSDIMMVENFR